MSERGDVIMPERRNAIRSRSHLRVTMGVLGMLQSLA